MSRLTEMQTRYKQKQLQEKEDRLKKLLVHPDQQQPSSMIQPTKTTTMMSTQRVTMLSTTTNNNGKQQQQQKAGIDRSYPLKPLKVNASVAASRTSHAAKTTVPPAKDSKKSRTLLDVRSMSPVPVRRNSDFGCDDINENQDIITTANVNNNNVKSKREVKKKELTPVQQRYRRGNDEDRSEVDEEVKTQSVLKKPFKSMNVRTTVEKIASTPNPVPKPRVERPVTKAPSVIRKVSPPPRASPTVRASSRQTIRDTQSSESNGNLAECKNCGRRFLPDRLEVHEKICTKTAKKKRKTYDALKHRVQGTELEPFAKKPSKLKTKSAPAKKAINWKQTHEEFINAIRAAKQAQAHLARGGKLSDLPPPPPSSNPDYVQCPNCGRRFNESAAQRHIPKCANYSFNKPKSGPTVKVAAPASKTRAMR